MTRLTDSPDDLALQVASLRRAVTTLLETGASLSRQNAVMAEKIRKLEATQAQQAQQIAFDRDMTLQHLATLRRALPDQMDAFAEIDAVLGIKHHHRLLSDADLKDRTT